MPVDTQDGVGLSDGERRERAAELRRIQEEKDRKMRELQAEFRADRTIVRPPSAAFCASSSHGGFQLGGNGVFGSGQQACSPDPNIHAGTGAQDGGPAASCSPEQEEQAAATRSPAVASANAAQQRSAAAHAAAARAAAVSPSADPTASTSAAAQTRLKGLFVPLPSPSRPQFNEGGISEEERRCRAADIKRLQAEREQARRNIATEFRADHHFRGGAQAARDSDTASAASAASSAPARAAQEVDTCLVQLRLPTGAMNQKAFRADDQLSAVTEWAHDVLREQGIYESCRLVLPPRQIMGEEEAGKSLYDLSLLPRVAFTVQLRSADGQVTSAPAAGSEFEAAFVNELTGMLESEGFTAWEAAQWGTLVQGQLQHGEMRQVRANVGALFGGLRLPSTIRAWAKRVDNAPQMPGPPKASDAALRFRRELSMCSDLDKERLGFEILPLPAAAEEPGLSPIPAPLVCTLRIYKLPPASALSRDLALLASEHSMPQELVLQLHFGADFPFMGPLVRVVYPILKHVPIVVGTVLAQGQAMESLDLGGDGYAEVPRVSVGMALQANAVAVALQGCRCGVWALNMGQSFPRYAAWLRNWFMGCGARVDTALSAQITPQGGAGAGGCKSNWYLPTVGGLWQGMQVVVKDRQGSDWHVALPAKLRVEVQEKMQVDAKGDGSGGDVDMAASSGGGALEEAANMDGDHEGDEDDQEEEEEIDPEVESLKKRALWVVEPVSFVELSTLGSWKEGGGRMSVGPVSSWDAADGTVVISPHVAASLGIMGPVSGGGESVGGGDIKLEVRGVEVREATRVLCRCVSLVAPYIQDAIARTHTHTHTHTHIAGRLSLRLIRRSAPYSHPRAFLPLCAQSAVRSAGQSCHLQSRCNYILARRQQGHVLRRPVLVCHPARQPCRRAAGVCCGAV
jgi:hypothetical protein